MRARKFLEEQKKKKNNFRSCLFVLKMQVNWIGHGFEFLDTRQHNYFQPHILFSATKLFCPFDFHFVNVISSKRCGDFELVRENRERA